MCRVMELAGCSIDYSSNMDRFLNGLLRDDCKKVDKFTVSDFSAFACLLFYYRRFQDF